jgi:hypothetical protein
MEIKNPLSISEFEVRADQFILAARAIATRMTSEGLLVELIATKPSTEIIDIAPKVAERLKKVNPKDAADIIRHGDELDRETGQLCRVSMHATIENQLAWWLFSDEVADLAESMNAEPEIGSHDDPFGEGSIDIIEDDPEAEDRSDEYYYLWSNNYIFR